MSPLRYFVVLLLPLVLLGCQRLGERLGLRQPVATLVELGPACPSTAVLSDAVTVTKLKTGAPAMPPNAANVVLTAEMTQAQLKCDYDRIKNTLSVDVSFAVKATRGAAAAGGTDPALDYFVAIVDTDGNVLSKRVFQSQPRITGPTGTFTQNVNNLPVPLGTEKRPADFEILTGFQLTAAELAYNRLPKQLPQPRRQ